MREEGGENGNKRKKGKRGRRGRGAEGVEGEKGVVERARSGFSTRSAKVSTRFLPERLGGKFVANTFLGNELLIDCLDYFVYEAGQVD